MDHSHLGFLTKRDTKVKIPRPTSVKNKMPAAIQITAEQILSEARERQEPEIRSPKQKNADSFKLAAYRRRKEFDRAVDKHSSADKELTVQRKSAPQKLKELFLANPHDAIDEVVDLLDGMERLTRIFESYDPDTYMELENW